MALSLKSLGKNISKVFNVSVISNQRFCELKSHANAFKALDNVHQLASAYPADVQTKVFQNLSASKSQLRQDLFALAESGFKRNGFFVEFGATNGVNLSNSHLMEKSFGWKGILAEPGKNWHTELRVNRTAIIEPCCIWSTSGHTLRFDECSDPELSTLSTFKNFDAKKASRKSIDTYEVETISLNDLLARHKAPRRIDYLSIDTEGSEFDILQPFDFTEHEFAVITCEHNHSSHRQKIYDLLTSKGYVRKFETISQFDDWYVKP